MRRVGPLRISQNGSQWCQTKLTITPRSTNPGAPVATSVLVQRGLPLLFTTDTSDPLLYTVTLTAMVRGSKDDTSREAAPFGNTGDTVSSWVTGGSCERYLRGLTSPAQIATLSDVNEGDRVCIVIQSQSPVVANIDLVEALACLLENVPNPNPTNATFHHIHASSDIHSIPQACSNVRFAPLIVPMFSLQDAACVRQHGSCGISNTERYDGHALDFPCVNATTAAQSQSLCRPPSGATVGMFFFFPLMRVCVRGSLQCFALLLLVLVTRAAINRRVTWEACGVKTWHVVLRLRSPARVTFPATRIRSITQARTKLVFDDACLWW
jgi:hypothetical protein